MDEPISIVPLNPGYQSEIEMWASTDPSKTLFKESNNQLNVNLGTQGWVALHNNEPVGAATISPNTNGLNFLYVVVKPSERRRGIGAKLVDAVLDDPYTKTLTRLHSLVDPENTGAQKILTNRGFSQVGYGQDGQIEFAFH